MATRLLIACAVVAPLVLPACASVLGIEDAICDPEIDSACVPNGSAGGGNEDAGPVVFTSLDDLCEEYCDLMGETCTSEVGAQQYETVAACQVICTRGLQLGAPGDRSEGNDTAYCRYESAQSAGTFGEVEFDCAASGLGAEGSCGPVCEVYCDLLANVCSEVEAVDDVAIIHDYDACLSECEALPRTEEPFDFEVSTGNTLECRMWHVQAAFGPASDLHCQHATGSAPCTD